MTNECANCGRTDSFLWPLDATASERDRLCALCWELRDVLDVAREAPRTEGRPSVSDRPHAVVRSHR